MKNTFLRLLFLGVASAAFLRAMYGIHGIAPARLTKHRSNNPDEESFVEIWGLSPCGPNAAANRAKATVDCPGEDANAIKIGVARIWRATSCEVFCDSVVSEPSDKAQAWPLSAEYDIWPSWHTDDNAGTGLWDIGSDSVDAPAPASVLKDRAEPSHDANQSAEPEPPPVRMLAEGPTLDQSVQPVGPVEGGTVADAQFFTPPDPSSTTDTENQSRSPFTRRWQFWSLRDREPDSGMDGGITVEAVELSQLAQLVLVGDGFEEFRFPIGVSVYCDALPSGIPEETRLVLVGGPTAIAAIGRSAIERVSPVRSDGGGSFDRLDNEFFRRTSYDGLWWDFFDRFNQNGLPGTADSHAVFRFPLCAHRRASMSNIATMFASSLNGHRLVIAADDGTLHLCYRNSLEELCRVEQSPDGEWRVIDTSNRFMSIDDFAEISADSRLDGPNRARLAAIDPFLQHYLLAITGDQSDLFSFSLGRPR